MSRPRVLGPARPAEKHSLAVSSADTLPQGANQPSGQSDGCASSSYRGGNGGHPNSAQPHSKLPQAPTSLYITKQDFMSQPTLIPWPRCSLNLRHGSGAVLVPVGTPQLPFKSVPIVALNTACRKAFHKSPDFEQVLSCSGCVRVRGSSSHSHCCEDKLASGQTMVQLPTQVSACDGV